MWSRIVEFMFACWLAIGPFVFGHIDGPARYWINDFACAVAVGTLALVSYWHPMRHAHLLIIPVGSWMIAFGYLHFGEAIPPGVQNVVITGLLLIMFAVIPNHAAQPPASWQRFYAEQQNAGSKDLPSTAAESKPAVREVTKAK